MQWFQRISHLNGIKSQGRHKFCWGQRKFSNGHCDLIPLQIFFILISLGTKVPLIIHTKCQPNIQSHSGEKVILMVLIFLVSAAILDSRPG